MNLCIINEHFSIQFENVTLLHFETISQRLHWEKIIIFSIHSTTSICAAAAAAKLLQSCPTLCDPIDGSPPGPTVPGILQARTLEWVAISFSNAEKWKVKVKSLSRVRLFETPWTAAYQAPPPMGFSRQEYWSGVPLPSLIYIYIYKLPQMPKRRTSGRQSWYALVKLGFYSWQWGDGHAGVTLFHVKIQTPRL